MSNMLEDILVESEIQDDLLNSSDVHFVASLIPSAVLDSDLYKFIELVKENNIGFSLRTDNDLIIIDRLWTTSKVKFTDLKDFFLSLSELLLFFEHDNEIIQLIGLLAIEDQVFKITLRKEFTPLISIEPLDQSKKITKRQPEFFQQEELKDPVMDLIFG